MRLVENIIVLKAKVIYQNVRYFKVKSLESQFLAFKDYRRRLAFIKI